MWSTAQGDPHAYLHIVVALGVSISLVQARATFVCEAEATANCTLPYLALRELPSALFTLTIMII